MGFLFEWAKPIKIKTHTLTLFTYIMDECPWEWELSLYAIRCFPLPKSIKTDEESSMNTLFIHNAALIEGSQPEAHRSIWIEDGVIRQVGADGSLQPQPGAMVLDAGGNIVSSGFIELQINGAFGQDFTLDPDSIWQVGRELTRFGVTTFLPTVITSPLETMDHAISVLKNERPEDYRGAEPLGLHIEGPFLNPARKGAHNPAYLRLPDSIPGGRMVAAKWGAAGYSGSRTARCCRNHPPAAPTRCHRERRAFNGDLRTSPERI